MRYIVILITIIAFWVTLGVVLSNIFADDVIATQLPGNNNSYLLDSAQFNDLNFTTNEENTGSNPSGAWSALKVMFLFSIPTAGFPNIISFMLSTINWTLLVVLVITIYKLANPISSG